MAPFTTARPSPKRHSCAARRSAYNSTEFCGGTSILNTHWMRSAKAAVDYLTAADYYASSPGDLLGNGFDHLDISDKLPTDVMRCLAHNLDPATGKVLRPRVKEGDRVGMDFTFNSPKSVGLAREMGGENNAGDPRVEAAHREAVAYAMGFVEADMQARVRVGGANENRATGNMFAYRVTHRDTRINADDQMPDPSLHDHVFVLNLTYDQVEQKFKAAEVAQIKHDAPFYEAIYHNRLAANLKALGYGVERKGKGFEIAGVSRELVEKFSRRSKHIDEVAAKLGITNPRAKAKLGAKTRLGKAKELADDLNRYYVSRLTDIEKIQLAGLEGKRSREVSTEAAVGYAIGHMFERRSVVDEKRLYETALRFGIGSVTPDGVREEAKRQGLLVKKGEATTKGVLAEEARVIAFARDGRGTCRGMGGAGGGIEPRQQQSGLLSTVQHHARPSSQELATLSPEQQTLSRHVLTSRDRVILLRGAAGTGKTSTMRHTIDQIDRPVVVLAPSADASRSVLRKEGFSEADTVAAFLSSKQMQEKARNGVIWVDEAALMPIRDTAAMFAKAGELNARVVLQGDPKQHRSVARDGDLFHLLQRHAGLPVAELIDIRRQKGKYKEAVAAIERGDILKGHDTLDGLGWVKQVDGNAEVVEDYFAARDAGKTVLLISPTHAQGDEITEAIRQRMAERGELKQEREVPVLESTQWTDAQKTDFENYDGTEVVQWHKNSGSFKAGQRVAVADLKRGQSMGKSSNFTVFRPATLKLAAGDTMRFTQNGWTADKKHHLDNGARYKVAGFEKGGGIRLENGWVVAGDFSHFTHGYVSTSFGGQGKTVDRVLVAMGKESGAAVNAEQFYVSASRAREKATIYTAIPPGELREAIQRQDTRKSATELMQRRDRSRLQRLFERGRDIYRRLRERAANDTHAEKVRRRTYGR